MYMLLICYIYIIIVRIIVFEYGLWIRKQLKWHALLLLLGIQLLLALLLFHNCQQNSLRRSVRIHVLNFGLYLKIWQQHVSWSIKNFNVTLRNKNIITHEHPRTYQIIQRLIFSAEHIVVNATHTVLAHQKDINSVTISPNDKFIATGSQDKTAKVKYWNIA